jgi:glucoamylase
MRGEDGALGPLIKDFITAETEQQKVTNPSGDFKSGEGLGEPKFYVNLTAFGGDWGRPQRGTRGGCPCAVTHCSRLRHL